ncbi:MAG: hypothetical protein JSV31_14820 [Desulfobacterales bacterium]|nr:MAG: hypothetical protein JSV31_14820 [Desulfobacterales bacterium]
MKSLITFIAVFMLCSCSTNNGSVIKPYLLNIDENVLNQEDDDGKIYIDLQGGFEQNKVLIWINQLNIYDKIITTHDHSTEFIERISHLKPADEFLITVSVDGQKWTSTINTKNGNFIGISLNFFDLDNHTWKNNIGVNIVQSKAPLFYD